MQTASALRLGTVLTVQSVCPPYRPTGTQYHLIWSPDHDMFHVFTIHMFSAASEAATFTLARATS